MKQRLFTMLLIAQLLVVGVGVARSAAGNDELPQAPTPAEVSFPRPSSALSIMTGAERADAVAAQWHDGAVLVYASMQIDWPIDPPPQTITALPAGGWLRYVYVAPISGRSSPFASLSVLIERSGGQFIQSSVSSWSVAPPATGLLEGIIVTDEVAALAAEIGGGSAYRAVCPEVRNQSLVALFREETSDDLVWGIGYRENGRNSPATRKIDVSATNGTVTVEREGSNSCGE